MRKEQKQTKAALVRLLTQPNARTLAAVAAFNNITVEACALRILARELANLREELNFRGQMKV